MILLGLLLLGATGAFTGLLIAENLSGGPDYTVMMLGNSVVTVNTLAAFLGGIALALIFCFGLALMSGGGVRHRHRAVARRTTRAERRYYKAPIERPSESATEPRERQKWTGQEGDKRPADLVSASGRDEPRHVRRTH